MTTSVTRQVWCCVSQHNTTPARPRPRPRPQCVRPRPGPIVWSQTGLVLRPTVSDHVTDTHIMTKILLSYVVGADNTCPLKRKTELRLRTDKSVLNPTKLS